ncbi:glutamate/aspartate:proton symporter [Escherichia coli]|uniref:Glutamate/aspartate:proton symporter n=1 Tax=Escherichia coli TaxID=562 RepID=A0A376RQZ7_ECOLX|nr:glutamate/aspartate:proton symporter [Escherichia coli]
MLFGLGAFSLPATHREPLVTVFRSISETMFKVTHMVMRYAPVGVFALIAVTVANFGFSSLWPLAKLVLLVHSPFCSSRWDAGNCGAPVRVKRLDPDSYSER